MLFIVMLVAAVCELFLNKYHVRALCRFLDILAGIFRRSQKKARGSRAEVRARRLAK